MTATINITITEEKETIDTVISTDKDKLTRYELAVAFVLKTSIAKLINMMHNKEGSLGTMVALTYGAIELGELFTDEDLSDDQKLEK